jgi:hypothetical protein
MAVFEGSGECLQNLRLPASRNKIYCRELTDGLGPVISKCASVSFQLKDSLSPYG